MPRSEIAMGSQSRFGCASCGYVARVSGGPDAGFFAATQTIACATCQRLYDVVTDRREPESLSGTTSAEWIPVRHPLRCPEDDAHPVVPWESGGPCPRCGHPMHDRGIELMWD